MSLVSIKASRLHIVLEPLGHLFSSCIYSHMIEAGNLSHRIHVYGISIPTFTTQTWKLKHLLVVVSNWMIFTNSLYRKWLEITKHPSILRWLFRAVWGHIFPSPSSCPIFRKQKAEAYFVEIGWLYCCSYPFSKKWMKKHPSKV